MKPLDVAQLFKCGKTQVYDTLKRKSDIVAAYMKGKFKIFYLSLFKKNCFKRIMFFFSSPRDGKAKENKAKKLDARN